ncbi:hypothetical protein Bca52824_019269 [Brassica carinata]|uniref:Mitochondrial Rho GTPase n=1 Tax=Brassica carinata TaxID=52824 RepID=A0A8X8AZE1_BRACI|nr:hypothetical protein Bca52824_019269 [Brassica carinata]
MIGLGGSHGSPKPVRIVVVGEKGTGKTSLIMAASNESSQPHQNIPPVLPYTTFPSEWFCDPVPATIIDTSSKPEDREKVVKEVKEADAIVLTFVVDRPETLDRLSGYWLPLFRQLEVRVPTILVGYSVTNNEYHNQFVIEIMTTSIREQYREIETCFNWSSRHDNSLVRVFWYAQQAVMNPIGPIYDRETISLKPRCVAALTRVYLFSTRDNDYNLNDIGLNYIQARCCYEPLTASQIRGLISFVQERSPLGVNENGITIDGFLFIYKYLVEQGRIRKVWNILRKFGYNNELRLADDMIPYSSFKRVPDQSVELTDEAIGFLRRIYKNLDEHGVKSLYLYSLDYLWDPWNMAPYKDAAEKTDDGGLSLEAFLSLWSLMTLIDPARSLECLICICYPSSSAVRVTRRRALDRKEQNSERRVVQCFVFGPKNAGKSALLNRFIGRPYDDDNNNGSNEERYAVNMVDNCGVTGDTKKTLVLKEVQIQENGLLPSNEALGACDVAIFVYDSSDESSWKRAIDLLAEVATASEDAGFEFPCLMVAAKTDVDSFPDAIQETTRATQDIGIGAPIPISSKLGDFDNLFQKILTAAEHPHLGVPQIESKKKRNRKLMKRSLMVVSKTLPLIASPSPIKSAVEAREGEQMAMTRATSGPAYPERFYAAASYVGLDGSDSSAKHVSSKFSNDTALIFYALYQQATVGPCGTPKPSAWRPVEQSKWKSWQGLGTMPSIEAMRLFVKILEEENPDWYSREFTDIPDPVVDVQISQTRDEPAVQNGNSFSKTKTISAENGRLSETQDKDVVSEDPNTVSVYNQWTAPQTSGQRPKARYEHGAAVIQDKMYIYGGNHNGRYLGDLHWNLLTLIDPARSLECLICLCYPSSAVRIARRRAIDRKEQNSDRRVFQCFVFGPKNAGKSALLNRFIGRSVCSFNSVYVKICMSDYMNLRPYDDDNNNGSNEERYAVNMVDNDGVTGDVKKTLVLKEIQMQEDGFLPSNEALGACDVAIFLYDSSDESSWKRAIDLLVKVATASEDAGLEFPCLMVAAKTDLDSFPEANQEATRVNTYHSS